MARNGIERDGLSEQRECRGRRSKAHTNLELFLQIVKGATVATHVSRPLIRHDDGGLGSGRGMGVGMWEGKRQRIMGQARVLQRVQ